MTHKEENKRAATLGDKKEEGSLRMDRKEKEKGERQGGKEAGGGGLGIKEKESSSSKHPGILTQHMR